MNADAIRHLYAYHFAQNRTLWERAILPLPQAQFVQPVAYSVGSVRDHIVHLMSVDDTWFCALRGLELPNMLDPADFDDKQQIRVRWDSIEQTMRTYLAELSDEHLNQKPFEGEDKDIWAWQALLQVVNHGTDHRAQVHRLVHDFGIPTVSQDYIFYAYEHLI